MFLSPVGRKISNVLSYLFSPIGEKHKKINKFVGLIMSFLKYPLINYLIGLNEYSNNCKDLCNLILVSRLINETMASIFINRGQFRLRDTKSMNPKNYKLINNILFDYDDVKETFTDTEIIFNKKIIVDNFPNVKSVKITHHFFLMNNRWLSPYKNRVQYDELPYPDLTTSLLELHLNLQNRDCFDPKDLPKNLTKLVWAPSTFPIKIGDLPNSLTELKFANCQATKDGCVDQSLEPGILPSNLLRFDIGGIKGIGFTYNSFPSSLTELRLSLPFKHELLPGHVPPNLTALSLGGNLTHVLNHSILPITLTDLDLGFYNNIIPNLLPPNLKKLHLGYRFNKSLEQKSLPSTLTDLNFGDVYNKQLNPSVLPVTLTKLTFGEAYDQPIVSGSLPNNLIEINFGFNFNQPLDDKAQGIFPKSLKKIKFGIHFNQPLIDSSNNRILPPHLQYLQLGHCFNQSFVDSNNICILPSSIKTLFFQLYMNHDSKDQYDEFAKNLQKTNFGKRHEFDNTYIVSQSVHNGGRNNEVIFTFDS